MACLYSVMLPWQQNTRQLKYQNTEVYLFILCYANFGDPGINGFGKIENATQVSKTVFSHLKGETHKNRATVTKSHLNERVCQRSCGGFRFLSLIISM